MSYETVEAGLLTIIRKADGYSANNTSSGDYRILGSGIKQAVILTPGSFRHGVSAAPRRIAWSWTVNIELFIPFQGEISSVAVLLRRGRQVVIDIIDQYPHLDSTAGVIDALVEGGGEPELWQGENRRWWVQKMQVLIKERTTVTIAE